MSEELTAENINRLANAWVAARASGVMPHWGRELLVTAFTAGMTALASDLAATRQKLAEAQADCAVYKDYVGVEIYRSDYQTASAMRADLESLRAQRDQAVLLAMDTLEQWRCGVGCHNGKVLTYAGDERSRYRTCPTCNGNGLHPKATAALAKLAALSPPPSDDTLKV